MHSNQLPDLTIRPFAAEEVDEHSRQFDLLSLVSPYDRHSMLLRAKKPQALRYLCASPEGSWLGMAIATPDHPYRIGPPGVYVEVVSVLQSHRNRGIGQTLLSVVEEAARARQQPHISINGMDLFGSKLLESLGYQTVTGYTKRDPTIYTKQLSL